MKISVVIPLFNEEESLQELYDKIQSELVEHDLTPYELIFINDGSTDESLKVLKELQAKDSSIRIIEFLRNYQKAAALATGFKLCCGEYVITMDADLQDDPKEIHKFIQKLETEKLDMISGWKEVRNDPLEKRIPSKFFNLAASIVGGIRLHDFNCGFKCYRKKVVKNIFHLVYGNMHRYIPLLAHWAGFKVGEMSVEHHARKHGKSKYGFARYFHGAMDLITLGFLNRFNFQPMHIFGFFGVITLLPGFLIELYFLIQWAMTQELHVRPLLLLGVVLIIVGIQFFSLGFISEMILQNKAKNLEYNYEEL